MIAAGYPDPCLGSITNVDMKKLSEQVCEDQMDAFAETCTLNYGLGESTAVKYVPTTLSMLLAGDAQHVQQHPELELNDGRAENRKALVRNWVARFETVFLPIHCLRTASSPQHWTLLVVRGHGGSIEYYDSLTDQGA